MCLAIPGRVLEIQRNEEPTMGTVSFGGIRKQVCLQWVPEVREGDYVLVHVGFAISLIKEAEARETWRLLEEINTLEDARTSSGEFGGEA